MALSFIEWCWIQYLKIKLTFSIFCLITHLRYSVFIFQWFSDLAGGLCCLEIWEGTTRSLVVPEDTSGPRELIGNWPDILGIHRKPSLTTTGFSAFVLLFWGRMPPCFLVCLAKKDDYHHQLPSLRPLLSCRKLKALFQKSPVHSPAARELNPPGWACLPQQHSSVDSLFSGHRLASGAAKLGISIAAAAEITHAALKKKCWHLGPLPDPLNWNL